MKKLLIVLLFAGFAVTTTSCNNAAAERERLAQQRALDSMKTELAYQKRMDSMQDVVRAQQQAIDSIHEARQREAVAVRNVSRRSAPRRSYVAASDTYVGAGQVAPVQQQQRQKKGWSAKAKGAAIGTGVGAITGAVVNGRNRGVGAIIGGVTGAAAGLGIGAIIDKKNGR